MVKGVARRVVGELRQRVVEHVPGKLGFLVVFALVHGPDADRHLEVVAVHVDQQVAVKISEMGPTPAGGLGGIGRETTGATSRREI